MEHKIEDILKKEGIYISTISGMSMHPMLRDRRDTIIVKPIIQPPGKYDVVLYRSQKKYVLHRIIKINKEYYIICGDNCIQKEIVYPDQVIGVLSEFYRDEKKVNMQNHLYYLYVRIWCSDWGLRQLCLKIKRKIAYIWHKLRRKIKNER